MQELDLTDLKCPLPVLKTKQALRSLSKGAQLAVITTDAMAAIDLPHFCAQEGHMLIEQQAMSETSLRFVIEKATDAPTL